MKRFIATITVLVLVLILSACNIETYEDGYEEGYSDGFFDGKVDGYSEGIEKAQHYISFRVDDDLWSLASDIEDEYGIHPDDAMDVFFRYADGHDDVSEEELSKAIWAIRRYYYKSHEVINEIEDYWID